jgi:acetyltransferase
MGVGIALSKHCLNVAREAGLKKIMMDILKVNTYMLNLSNSLGFKRVHSYDDYITVEYLIGDA